MIDMKALLADAAEHLINERAERLKLYDDAHPDIGMGMSFSMCRNQAIQDLKREGKVPRDYKEPTESIDQPLVAKADYT